MPNLEDFIERHKEQCPSCRDDDGVGCQELVHMHTVGYPEYDPNCGACNPDGFIVEGPFISDTGPGLMVELSALRDRMRDGSEEGYWLDLEAIIEKWQHQ